MPRHALSTAVFVFVLLAVAITPARAQNRDADFRKLAFQLAQQRFHADEEKEATQEQALALLDNIALAALNAPAPFDLAALHQRLSSLVTQEPPVGENYRVFLVMGEHRAGAPALAAGARFALVANFSQSGPSAVRLYSPASSPSRYRLASRIDRFTQPDLFDEYLELVPVSTSAGVFVTVTGRTDELQSGSFMAWRFAAEKVELLWASDLLEHSTYEVAGGEFLVTYCAEAHEDRPRACKKMVRDRFAFSAGSWKRLDQSEVPAPKP